MSPRPDVSAQRIPQILDAAQTVFARDGIAAATVARVAMEAGVSSALVFLYFRTKDELILAFVRRYFAGAREVLDHLAAAEAPLRETLHRWCDALADELEAAESRAIGQELLSLAARRPDLQEVVSEAYAAYRATLSRLVAREHKGDADAIATTLIAMIEGINVLQLATGGSELAAAYRRGVDVVLAGLTPPER